MNTTPHTKPLPYDDALSLALAACRRLEVEEVRLDAALGRVLRRDVICDRDQPPFDRSAMDGFAVRSGLISPGKPWRIEGAIPAGAEPASFQVEMPRDRVKRIATGAPLPVGADAVIPIEQADVQGDDVVFSVASVKAWDNVHRRASDATAGNVAIHAGARMGAWHVGIAAAVGTTALTVTRKPRITLLTTGDEVRPPTTPTDQLQPQQIRNSNGAMLLALLESLHTPALRHLHVPDQADATRDALAEAMRQSDMVITVGGASVGERDWLPRTCDALGLRRVLHGVAIQPGKPVLIAAGESAVVVGLPGNPVSVLATAHLFALPMIDRMLGSSQTSAAWRSVTLAEPIKATAKREVFRAARCDPAGRVSVVQWHGSGDLMHTATADGFVRLPREDRIVEKGESLPFLPLAR